MNNTTFRNIIFQLIISCKFPLLSANLQKQYTEIVGYVFAEETLTHKVIKPRKFIQWIKVSKISSDKQSLAVELQQITFNNSVCSNSFITLQTISQGNCYQVITKLKQNIF